MDVILEYGFSLVELFGHELVEVGMLHGRDEGVHFVVVDQGAEL